MIRTCALSAVRDQAPHRSLITQTVKKSTKSYGCALRNIGKAAGFVAIGCLRRVRPCVLRRSMEDVASEDAGLLGDSRTLLQFHNAEFIRRETQGLNEIELTFGRD
ncbi:unnamed protein product [Durusdinium trenchii]|uniref:Uncharacterized protein n=1 Tax=Durusdinium trenchii TaxID=1381693 RepID=A0ABP0LFB0_9DINO